MNVSKPYLIFLHGLLGNKDEWKIIIDKINTFPCLPVDLPNHGLAQNVSIDNFDQVCHYISTQIKQIIDNQPYYLIGYSLGGRIALHYALHWRKNNWQQAGQLQGLVLEGANLGLQEEQDKQTRWQQDCIWAERFNQEQMEKVLQDWYQQTVFASLTAQQRQYLIHQRAQNSGKNIAQILKATSLAKQMDFREKLHSSDLFIHYFCGERDQKFRNIAEQNHLELTLIPRAGHNAHWENPTDFAQYLENIILAELNKI